VIRHLLSIKPSGERWAVLDNDGTGLIAAAQDAQVSTLAGGCICCADVGLRVGLTRLLREARPQRLLLLPSAQARIPDVIRLLSDRWLAPVLDLRATIAVLDAASAVLMAADNADGKSALVHAAMIALERRGTTRRDFAESHRKISRAAPGARIVAVRDGALDARLLDAPGPMLQSRFHSG
jgi:G3E family GTPase